MNRRPAAAIPGAQQRRFAPVAVIAFIWAVTVSIYWVGLSGPMLFDDGPNITNNASLRFAEFDLDNVLGAMNSGGESDGWMRGGAMLTFALTYYLTDGATSTLHFKGVNLGIHMLNTALVYLLAGSLWSAVAARDARNGFSRSGLASYWVVPAAVAGFWAVHPIQLTGVLYVVQRLTSLSAMCVLLGLLSYARGRLLLADKPAVGLVWMIVPPAMAGLVGLLFKENAVLIIFLIPVVELAFHDRQDGTSTIVRRYLAVVCLMPAIVLALAIGAKWEAIEGAYQFRDFSMGERLMTQARVLWSYIGMLALPDPTRFALFHDEVAVSRGLLSPATTVLAIAAWAVAIVYSALNRTSMLAFAVFWYLAAHLLESSFIGLELMFEHRNYLPSVGLWIGLVFALARVVSRFDVSRVIVTLAVAIFGTLSALSTSAIAATWTSAYEWADAGVRNFPESTRFKSDLANIVLQSHRDADRGLTLLKEAVELDPSNFSAAILAFQVASSAAFYEGIAAKADGVAASHPRNSLAPEPEELVAFADQLSEDIVRRLEASPRITSSTISALQRVVGCAVQGDPMCHAKIGDYMSWMRASIQYGKSAGAYRAELWNQLSRLHAAKGEQDDSVRALRKSIELAPAEWLYRMSLIDALLVDGRLDEAGGLIEKHRASRSGTLRFRSVIEQRWTMLDDARRSSSDPEVQHQALMDVLVGDEAGDAEASSITDTSATQPSPSTTSPAKP